jgi:hypothetical protein
MSCRRTFAGIRLVAPFSSSLHRAKTMNDVAAPS